MGSSGAPIRQELLACHTPATAERMKASQAASSAISVASASPSITARCRNWRRIHSGPSRNSAAMRVRIVLRRLMAPIWRTFSL